MNIKALMAAGTVAAAASALAAVTTTNTLCRIEVDGHSTETILSVPLIDVCGTDQSINITNLVMTTNLETGDALMYKDGDTWYAWVIAGGKWTAATTTVGGKSVTAPDSAAFSRGSGVWLVRGDTSKAKSVYLYGQCDARTTSTSFAAGTKASPVYTLMGHPKEVAFDPNSVTWTGCAQGDKLAFADASGNTKTLTYRTGKGWCEVSEVNNVPTWVATTATIPAGQGFWYVSVGESAGSVTW